MKDVVENKIIKELNWKERIVVKIFRKTFYKMYRLGMMDCFNYCNK